MPAVDQASLRNVLLRQLAPEDFALLVPHLEPVEMQSGEVLSEPGQPFAYATFPEHGIASIVSVSPGGQMVESGLVGHDGFTPVSLVLGADRSLQRTVVQVPGHGHRIEAQALSEALEPSPGLHRLLLRFAHTLAMQASQTALSNVVHPIDQRLARWLLMCHDRVVGDELTLIHKFIAFMLAVRRPSVTTSLSTLRDAGLVQIKRGIVIVTDRLGLEAFAADAYGQPEAEYERLIAPMR